MRLSKKLAIAAVSTVAAVGIATSAFAYWSTTGSGTGSASAASANGTVTLHGVINVSAHAPYPGGSNPVSFNADNAGATDLRVGTIHLDSVSVDAGHAYDAAINPGGCQVGDFSMVDVVSNTTVLHGASGQSITGAGSLAFANDSVKSQDGCKGAVITLNLSSN